MVLFSSGMVLHEQCTRACISMLSLIPTNKEPSLLEAYFGFYNVLL